MECAVVTVVVRVYTSIVGGSSSFMHFRALVIRDVTRVVVVPRPKGPI